ncbi:MAG TPA: trypsin-like peptidase domain-containing protein [Methylomirabilota bacterium]|jgi:serine protease Do|nr:trypsin-like peptidase domain-containing protein [Methylomirabilota bacterium]
MPLILLLRRRILHVFARIAFLLCCAFCGLAAPTYGQSQAPAKSANPFDAAVDTLIKKVSPSVVQIVVTAYAPLEETGRGNTGVVLGRQRASGSGFIIDGDGYIITNAHVVNGAQRVQVVLPPSNPDGSLAAALSSRADVVAARIVGVAREKDLALLKIEGTKLPALALASYRELRQGHAVFAFGSPEGLRNSISHGVISAVSRQLDPDSPLIYIQTDAPINPGNSGGPLVNMDGEVVGVNTFILSQSGGNEGLGFAIPSATVRTVYRQLKEFGHLRRQEIGVGIQTITPAMAAGLGLKKNYGVIISDVLPGGPAEAAGLMVGDVLVSIDGEPADNLPSVNYHFLLRDSADKAQITVLRKNGQETFSVAPVEEGQDIDQLISMADPEKNLVPGLGIVGVELDKKTAAMVRGLRDPYGIVVTARVTGSSGEVPLQPGDVIRSLNKQPMTTLDRLRSAVKAVAAGAPIVLQVQRDGKLLYVPITLE